MKKNPIMNEEFKLLLKKKKKKNNNNNNVEGESVVSTILKNYSLHYTEIFIKK